MSTQTLPDGSELLLRVVYSTRERQGVIALVVVSCISLVAVVALLSALSLSSLNTRTSLDKHLFVRTHVAAYFICLLLCDLLQAMGSIINVRWINRMGVESGNICILQGVLKQASDIGTAFWTLVIAIHTFCLLFLELKLRTFVLWVTLIGGWSTITTLVLIGPVAVGGDQLVPFFGISGYWCWISPRYKTERITLDYLIMFLAAFFSLLLYTLIFLRLRGNVVRSGWRVRFRRTSEGDTENWRGRKFPEDQAMAIAKQMLLYPLAYIVLVLPIASARFAYWAGSKVPFEVTIFADFVFLLSGLANVILFTTTRRILPRQSIRFDRWSVTRLRDLPPTPDGHGGDPQAQPEVRMNLPTHISQDGISIKTSPSYHTDGSQTRKDKSRPPDIIIRRDSVESMYSVYDDEEAQDGKHMTIPQRVSSRWSPDGFPQRQIAFSK